MAQPQHNADPRELAGHLTREELTEVLAFSSACLSCATEEEFCELLRGFSSFLGFEYLLYAYMRSHYLRQEPVILVNLSNPIDWMSEYDRRGYVENDPVRMELEVRLARKESHGIILWDAYDRALSPIEEEIIERRSHYGLRYGFSAFCNSPRHESVSVVSFASKTKIPDERSQILGGFVVSHLNRCRKRLDLQSRVSRLTKREQNVARWLIEGKTNWEIAQLMNVTESTIKYHVANILTKLQTTSRQSAVAILMAERFLA